MILCCLQSKLLINPQEQHFFHWMYHENKIISNTRYFGSITSLFLLWVWSFRNTDRKLLRHIRNEPRCCVLSCVMDDMYGTCMESSRRSAWSSFCIKSEANGLHQHQHKRLRGLRTAITAPVHPSPAALFSQCIFGCSLTGQQQTTNSPLSLRSALHAKHMK